MSTETIVRVTCDGCGKVIQLKDDSGHNISTTGVHYVSKSSGDYCRQCWGSRNEDAADKLEAIERVVGPYDSPLATLIRNILND